MYSAQNLIEYTHSLHRLWQYLEGGGMVNIFTVRQEGNRMKIYGCTPGYDSWWNPITLLFLPPNYTLEPEYEADWIKLQYLSDSRGVGETYFPQYKMMSPYASRYHFLQPLSVMMKHHHAKEEFNRTVKEGKTGEYIQKFFGESRSINKDIIDRLKES